jgi:hypothetical protein
MKRVPASVTRLVYLCSGPLPSMIKARRPLHVLVREQTPIDRTQYRLKHDVEVLCTRANNASTSTEDDDCNVGNVVRLDNLPAKQKTTTCNNGAVDGRCCLRLFANTRCRSRSASCWQPTHSSRPCACSC